MFLALEIQDFVIVERLRLEFGEGFGVFTGETGAGKSILVDALLLVLGARADAGVVRAGCDPHEPGRPLSSVGAAFARGGVRGWADGDAH